jgi:DNA-binding transcriptional LysR family regulator
VRLRVANDNWANLLPLLRRRELDLAVVDVRAITDDQDFLITRLTRRQGYLAVRRGHQLLKGRRHRLFDRRVRRRSHCRRWSGNGFLSNPLMG